MKVPHYFAFLITFQIVLVNCRLSPTFSCALGINFMTVSSEMMDRVFFKNVQSKVSYHLYTKEKPSGEEITSTVESLGNSTFNFNRPTKFITHGYWSKKESESCKIPREAFILFNDYNVVVVDWWKMESLYNVPIVYSAACKNLYKVADHVAEMINFLEDQGLDLNTTTLIGHSLGAHLMGVAGSKARNKISQIIGLDPAAPNFENKDPAERLSPDDAKTVHVIHSNGGDCGIHQPLGHFDFYPNGGNKQPGCWMNSCAHSRAYELFAESIYSKDGFYANWCSDLSFDKSCTNDSVKMDEYLTVDNAKNGIYYLKTRESFPYAIGR